MKNATLLNKLLRIEQNGSVNLDPDFLDLLAEVKQKTGNEAIIIPINPKAIETATAD